MRTRFDVPASRLSHLEGGVFNLFLELCSKSKEDNMAGLDSTVLTVVAGLFGIVIVIGFMATRIYK